MKTKHQFFVDINNFPNKLCIFRLVVILISVTCLLVGLPLAASFIGLIAGLTDKWDGIYARKHNMCTQLGALLDQISDLIFNFFCISGAVVMGIWPVWVLFLWGFRDLSVLCMRTSAGQLGFTIPSSQLGKVATFEMMCALFFMPLDWALNNESYMFRDFVVEHFHPYVGVGMHWFALLGILVGIGMQYVSAAKYAKAYIDKYDEVCRPKSDKNKSTDSEKPADSDEKSGDSDEKSGDSDEKSDDMDEKSADTTSNE
ncbi:MAG: CDP-alcohol phosphatidyltransferase family protein [Proteobacteria bacterium]|nr:CDP-alcohol phosphatidyltransferase family protein [Pseudomonadota bacterium]